MKSAKTNTKKGQSQHKSTTILKSDKTDTKKGQSQHNLKIKHDLPKMWTWTWWMGHGGYGGHGHGGHGHGGHGHGGHGHGGHGHDGYGEEAAAGASSQEETEELHWELDL